VTNVAPVLALFERRKLPTRLSITDHTVRAQLHGRRFDTQGIKQYS
jgi:hypothetical protein